MLESLQHFHKEHCRYKRSTFFTLTQIFSRVTKVKAGVTWSLLLLMMTAGPLSTAVMEASGAWSYDWLLCFSCLCLVHIQAHSWRFVEEWAHRQFISPRPGHFCRLQLHEKWRTLSLVHRLWHELNVTSQITQVGMTLCDTSAGFMVF